MTCLCQQHIRHCNWEDFDGREEFLDEVQRKGAKLGKRMVYEKKKEIREKYLKEPPTWIFGTIKRELNLFELLNNETLEDLQEHHEIALAIFDSSLVLVSIHGVAFTMTDRTMYFILNLIEFTRIVHIIVVTLFYIVISLRKALLLLPPLPQHSRGHVQYIAQVVIQWPL
jgi:hypothetical protein